MQTDSGEWFAQLASDVERSLNLTLGFCENGAFGLETVGGVGVLVEPVQGFCGAMFSAEVGVVTDETPKSLLHALLIANGDVAIVGLSRVGVHPVSGAIVLRAVWLPTEQAASSEHFARELAVFMKHADGLAETITNGQLETLLLSGKREGRVDTNLPSGAQLA